MGRRRVLLVLDTTDSFWPEQEPFLNMALVRLAALLEPGDICVPWIMGDQDPASECRRGPIPETLVRDLLGVLEPFPRGSWLSETITEIEAKSRRGASPDWEDYLIILTDGKIHDAVAAPVPFWIKHNRIELITPHWTDSDLGGWKKFYQVWTSESLDMLAQKPSEAKVIPNPGEAALAVYRYSPAPITRIESGFKVQPGSAVELCYLGGKEPRPFLDCGGGAKHAFYWSNRQSGSPGDERATHMPRIAELLLAPWNRTALEALHTKGGGTIIHCGKEQTVVREQPPNEARCSECGGCLLVQEEGFQVTDRDQSIVLVFPFPVESGNLPEYRSPVEVCVGCYEVHSEGNREYLVLKFVPTAF